MLNWSNSTDLNDKIAKGSFGDFLNCTEEGKELASQVAVILVNCDRNNPKSVDEFVELAREYGVELTTQATNDILYMLSNRDISIGDIVSHLAGEIIKTRRGVYDAPKHFPEHSTSDASLFKLYERGSGESVTRVFPRVENFDTPSGASMKSFDNTVRVSLNISIPFHER